jgi:hypothetical protein
MVSSVLLRRVALVRTDVSQEPGASFIRVTKIGELGQHKLQLATDVRCEKMVFLRSLRRLLVAACVVPSSPNFYPDEGGARFLRNVGSYKSHTA